MVFALPGTVVTYDYRQPPSEPSIDTPEIPRPLRVLQWNIERGYQLDKVLKILKQVDADILCLQELDINNERSGKQNHVEIIAQQLQLNAACVIEFQELQSPCRTPAQQGGGLHGNAVFSKYQMEYRVIKHYDAYDWPRDGMLLGEPRLGGRYTLAARVYVPGRPPLLAYSAHFECFTGIIGRTLQLCDLLEDSTRQVSSTPHQLVCGDFNTFAHSLARFSPRYAHGWYRFRTLGMSEPEWWIENILSWYKSDGPVNKQVGRGLPGNLRFTRKATAALVNPGWWDPFDPVKDITISNHAGFMTAKADWLFVRQFRVVRHWMANCNFAASDHRCLVLDVEYAREDLVNEHMEMTKRLARDLKLKRTTKAWTWCSLAAAAFLSWAAYRFAKTNAISRVPTTLSY
ncbi:hypothetical protein IWW36_000869 [Coemansia brasiliensis]|uniref:Endonuclease/exonuclease/phosphatase domain-containing protein n=1 Tax=Coemansia brasiliensis TaxID=2650707 RepID=A0A9W8IHT9_9FUNG|nr:hypothetical protein IWW36_000869 [Coemansia brasiliensis]